ncbi:excisionase family protein [Glaciecola sp. MF2-115]|uniref:excisionase family protein n=1 Tax=Glaciecola sp. MF2-115 TaxID=3384827 RepID=UPI0039A0EA81
MKKKVVPSTNTGMFQLGWVHPRIVEAFKGLTADQLTSRRKSGKFIEGIHWVKDPVGTIMWHFENLDSWVEGKQ